MSRIPPQGAQIVGAWSEHTNPARTRPAHTERATGTDRVERVEPVGMVEAVMESAPAPARRRARHPHLSSLGRRLHLVH